MNIVMHPFTVRSIQAANFRRYMHEKFGEISIHPGVKSGRRVHPLVNTSKPRKAK